MHLVRLLNFFCDEENLLTFKRFLRFFLFFSFFLLFFFLLRLGNGRQLAKDECWRPCCDKARLEIAKSRRGQASPRVGEAPVRSPTIAKLGDQLEEEEENDRKKKKEKEKNLILDCSQEKRSDFSLLLDYVLNLLSGIEN